ncbi:MAG: 2-C-methyl-D-erythritol 4-phosphate cytidylyltransferase [Cytophagales bacterium]
MQPNIEHKSDTYVIIVAGGSGTRMGSDIPKQFISIGGIPILMHTIQKFFDFNNNINIVLVLPQSQISFWENLCEKYDFAPKHQIIAGGNTRFQSVKNGLQAIGGEGVVAIHDGVRPFVSLETIAESFDVAKAKGNAVTHVKLKDSIRIIDENLQSKALDRNNYVLVQTPQTFQIPLIKKAFENEENMAFTDDATVLEAIGEQINLTEGSYENIKITTAEDLHYAEYLLSKTF